MENQTRFDLNAAVEKWRLELAAQAKLASDDRRELEAHLRDAIADFQQRGLNDEECFWLARRRAGQPQELGEEFVKANPAKFYRERAFWLAFGLLIYRLWDMLASSLITPLSMRVYRPPHEHFGFLFPDWVSFYLPSWLRDLNLAPMFQYSIGSIDFLLVLTALIFVARGKLEKLRSMFEVIFTNRLRFVIIAMLSLFVVSAVSNLIFNSLCVEMLRGKFLPNYFYSDFWSAWIIAIVAWLMPSQNRSPSQLA
jgi:hypothetical protein